MSTRMEGAARALSDAYYAFLGAAPGRRRKVSWTWTWTWMDAAACAWARSCQTEIAQGHPSLLLLPLLQ